MKDSEMREPLFDYLDEAYGKNRIFEEKMIGRSRADIIMIVENEFIGFEIKSDSDTYDRLERQTGDYSRYCDKNFVVVGKSHEKHVEEHIPEYWGILSIYEDENEHVIKVRKLKDSQKSPKATLKNQIKLLWRPEIASIQDKEELPKYKTKSKKFVQELLLERVEESLLKAYIIEELFERDYDSIAETINNFRAENNLKKRRNTAPKKRAKKARKAMKD